MFQSWLAKKLITFVMGRTRQGDVRPTLLLDAPDVELTFPGRNSWSGTFRGKDEVARWLARFAAVGIQIFPDEVVADRLSLAHHRVRARARLPARRRRAPPSTRTAT